MLLRFGDCALDPEALELRRGGEAVALSPRAFRLIVLLLQSRPRALSHQRLRDALWPDTLAGYTILAKLVAEARRAIGDRLGGPPLVRTVARFGYAFVGPGPRSRGCAPRAAAEGAPPLSDRVVSHYRLLEPIGRVGSLPRRGEGERRRAHPVRAGGQCPRAHRPRGPADGTAITLVRARSEECRTCFSWRDCRRAHARRGEEVTCPAEGSEQRSASLRWW